MPLLRDVSMRVRLTKAHLEELRRHAARSGVTVSELVRSVVAAWLLTQPPVQPDDLGPRSTLYPPPGDTPSAARP